MGIKKLLKKTGIPKEGKSKKEAYKSFPTDALEEVEFVKIHGTNVKGDKKKVHPNTAILFRNRKIAK